MVTVGAGALRRELASGREPHSVVWQGHGGSGPHLSLKAGHVISAEPASSIQLLRREWNSQDALLRAGLSGFLGFTCPLISCEFQTRPRQHHHGHLNNKSKLFPHFTFPSRGKTFGTQGPSRPFLFLMSLSQTWLQRLNVLDYKNVHYMGVFL